MTSRGVSITLRLILALQFIHVSLGQGVVYTLSNADESNSIFINSFGADGQLKYETAIEIPGAKGSGGLLAELHSANPLIQRGNFLFCVNAGSDSVTSFTINPADPKEIKIVSTESSGGDYPTTLGMSTDLKMLCVANAGEVSKGGVFCYTVDTTTGKITPKTGGLTAFGVPTLKLPAGPPGLGSPSDILFTQGDKYVTVSVKSINPPLTGHIVSFPVESTSQPGQLKAPIVNEVGWVPYSMNILNPGAGANIIAYLDPGPARSRVCTLSFKDGKKQCGKCAAIPKQANICWSEISPQNKRYYIIDADDAVTPAPGGKVNGTGEIHELTLDIPNLGITRLESLGNIPRNLLDGRIVTVGGKDILYVVQVKDPDCPKPDEHGIIAVEVHPGPMKIIQSHYVGPDGKSFPRSMLGMAVFVTKP